jgi:hypothetical protein
MCVYVTVVSSPKFLGYVVTLGSPSLLSLDPLYHYHPLLGPHRNVSSAPFTRRVKNAVTEVGRHS